MIRTTSIARVSSATAAAVLVLCLAAAPAPARPDPGEPVRVQQSNRLNDCPLRRVGRQLVRCDYLTGGGVLAPLSVPELGTRPAHQPPYHNRSRRHDHAQFDGDW